MAKDQIEGRQRLVLAPAHARIDEAGKGVSDEFLKGEIAGISQFLQLPEILIETLTAVNQSLEKTNVDTESDSKQADE